MNLTFLKVKDSNRIYLGRSCVIILQTVSDKANITIAIKCEVALGYRLAYIHLTVAHSLGHGHFDCKYITNSNSWGKNYYDHQIESPISAFDWHIYI